MKRFFLLGMLIAVFTSFTEKQMPVIVIFDTDIAPDYDDVGALAMLHTFADRGKARILATISSNRFETTAPTLSVINTYYNRPDIPIGVLKTAGPNYSCRRLWAEGIISKYPHSVKSNGEAMDAVKLYRKILSSQPDRSVTIVTVGYFTNLAGLLRSPSDEYSSLNGSELVRKKVKRLISMAGGIDSSGNSGYESNVMADIAASQKVFADRPAPITLSGFEIGVNIFTGTGLIHNPAIQNSPVKMLTGLHLTTMGAHRGITVGIKRRYWLRCGALNHILIPEN
jgi:inosine-uridine nucleoside N-ribohydrolase